MTNKIIESMIVLLNGKHSINLTRVEEELYQILQLFKMKLHITKQKIIKINAHCQFSNIIYQLYIRLLEKNCIYIFFSAILN